MDIKEIDFTKLKKYLPIVLILIAIGFSTYYRNIPASLPLIDTFAEKTVNNYYQEQIANSIEQSYPLLPQEQKNILINNQFNEFSKANKEEINQNILQLSNNYKDVLKDDTGQIYLCDIDTYYWQSEARNVLQYGQLGDSYNEEGKRIFSLRNGRFGKEITQYWFHPLAEAWLYKILNFFNKDITLTWVVFYISVIIINLSIIPAFMIGKKLFGNISGFFAAFIIAINTSLITRTPSCVADTDAYTIFFPLFIIWFYLLAIDSKKWHKYLFAILTGFTVAIFNTAWPGASYIIPMIVGCSVLYIGYLIITKKEYKEASKVFITYVISSFIFISLSKGVAFYFHTFMAPINFLGIKNVATETIWPNVMTTVAEFNEQAFGKIVGHMGGNVLLLLAIIGIAYLIFYERKHFKYSFYIIPWFLATLVPFTQGVRFSILLIPSFAILLGVGVYCIVKYASEFLEKGIHLPKWLCYTVVLILVSLLFIPELNSTKEAVKQDMPYVDDGWYNTLMFIKNNSSNDSIITSWWDFGHWFVNIAQRHVTFDGANQGQRIHWVGKALSTNNETEAVNILKMLNCGQERAYSELKKLYNDEYKTINRLYELLRGEDVLPSEEFIYNTYINCDDVWEQYFIASEDMVGKSGVWSHFGTWNFLKAQMYINVDHLNPIDGVNYIINNFNYSRELAEQIYNDIQNTVADKYISGWEGYDKAIRCSQINETLSCSSVEINTINMSIKIKEGNLDSLSYLDNGTFKVKHYENGIGLSGILYEDNGRIYLQLASPIHVDSIFTKMFFFKGVGLKHFNLVYDTVSFNGDNIYVYQVDFNGLRTNTSER